MKILLFVLLDLDGYSVEALKEAAPVSEKVRQELVFEGVRVLGADKKPFVDVWLRKSLPAGEARDLLGVRFPSLQDGMLLGVARFHSEGADYKNIKLKAGIYTLRYLTQPEDGDHLGTAESRDFLVLAPAADDVSPAPLKAEEMIKLSGKVSGKKHPSVLYLMKGEGAEKLPRVVHDEAKNLRILEVELKPLRLSIVVAGKAADF